MELKKRVLVVFIGLSLVSSGALAGTVIKSYKTPRGNIATVEQEDIHKNRIGITVNGNKVNKDTWYSNSVTYAPLREVSEILGAEIKYNNKTMSADIVLNNSETLNFDYIQSVTKLNRTVDSTEPLINSLIGFWKSMSIAFEGILLYDRAIDIDYAVENLNKNIEMYNNSIDFVNARHLEIESKGYLTQYDINITNDILTNLSDSIDYYKLSMDNLYYYYDTKNDFYADEYRKYATHAQQSAIVAGEIATTAQLDYFLEIENYKEVSSIQSKTASITASDLEYKQKIKIRNH